MVRADAGSGRFSGPLFNSFAAAPAPQRLFKAQQHHDRKHWDERCQLPEKTRATTPWTDYLRPIIADADTG